MTVRIRSAPAAIVKSWPQITVPPVTLPSWAHRKPPHVTNDHAVGNVSVTKRICCAIPDRLKIQIRYMIDWPTLTLFAAGSFAIFRMPDCGVQPAVCVGVGVFVGVFVGVSVGVFVGVSVGVFVGVFVFVGVSVFVGVFDGVGVFVGVRVGVLVDVRVGVFVGTTVVGVFVGATIVGVFVGTTVVGVSVGVCVGGRGVLVAWRGVLVGGAGVSVGGTCVSVGTTCVSVGTTCVSVGGTAVGGRGVLVDWRGVSVGGAGVSVGGTAVGDGETIGVVRGASVAVLVGRLVASDPRVGMGESTITIGVLGGTVPSSCVAVGPLIVGRGVTVGSGVSTTPPGVFVGAFSGGAITITSWVGMLAAGSGVGLVVATATAVARSAASAAAASGAIGGSRSSIFQGR